MNTEITKYAQTHKVLTLQIRKENFLTILDGSQKVEHRIIYPSNQGMYILDPLGSCRENKLRTRPYDALYLINGRRADAPRLLVEVEYSEFVIMTDEAGRKLKFVREGATYYDCQVWYHLGKVLATEGFESIEELTLQKPKKATKPKAKKVALVPPIEKYLKDIWANQLSTNDIQHDLESFGCSGISNNGDNVTCLLAYEGSYYKLTYSLEVSMKPLPYHLKFVSAKKIQ